MRGDMPSQSASPPRLRLPLLPLAPPPVPTACPPCPPPPPPPLLQPALAPSTRWCRRRAAARTGSFGAWRRALSWAAGWRHSLCRCGGSSGRLPPRVVGTKRHVRAQLQGVHQHSSRVRLFAAMHSPRSGTPRRPNAPCGCAFAPPPGVQQPRGAPVQLLPALHRGSQGLQVGRRRAADAGLLVA